VGTLYYGDARVPIEVEDRALAHVKFVILAKLRRNEGFGFSWVKPLSEGSGRGTVWIHPSIALHFEFSGSRSPNLNRAWLEALTQQAATSGGLTIVEEPPGEPSPEEVPLTIRTA
jgi:hypothetical protein